MREENELQRATSTVSLRLPTDLKASLARDAAALGVSFSDVARMRLQTGCVPTFQKENLNGR
jgi:hypothetical protein